MSLNVFTEGGEWSWRKTMTAGCLVIFLLAQIGYLVINDFAELPTSYWSVDAGIFAFYFGKDFFRNISLTTKSE